jgi:hypothetical protein
MSAMLPRLSGATLAHAGASTASLPNDDARLRVLHIFVSTK